MVIATQIQTLITDTVHGMEEKVFHLSDLGQTSEVLRIGCKPCDQQETPSLGST